LSLIARCMKSIFFKFGQWKISRSLWQPTSFPCPLPCPLLFCASGHFGSRLERGFLPHTHAEYPVFGVCRFSFSSPFLKAAVLHRPFESVSLLFCESGACVCNNFSFPLLLSSYGFCLCLGVSSSRTLGQTSCFFLTFFTLFSLHIPCCSPCGSCGPYGHGLQHARPFLWLFLERSGFVFFASVTGWPSPLFHISVFLFYFF